MNGGRRPNPGRGTANLNKTNDYQMTIRIINKNVKTTAPCHEYTNACRVNMAMHTRQAPGAHVSAACLDETAYCLVCMRVLYETHIHPSRGETAHAVHTPLSLPPPQTLPSTPPLPCSAEAAPSPTLRWHACGRSPAQTLRRGRSSASSG